MRLTWSALAAVMLMPAASAQTLVDALNRAYETNPSLEASRLGVEAADEGFAQVRAGRLPSLDLTSSYGLRRSWSLQPGFFGGATSNAINTDPQSLGVQAVQPIITGGRVAGQSQIAAAAAGAAREGLRSTEHSILVQVITAYVDVLRDQRALEIRRTNVERLTQQRAAAQDRFEVGEITRTDVAQAEARLAGASAQLAGAEAALASSTAQYAGLVGMEPVGLTTPPAPPPLPETLEQAIERALLINPDYLEAKAGERQAQGQVQVERSSLMPQLSIVARYDRGIDLNQRNTESESGSAVAQIAIPLFEGGFARSRTRQARVNLERSTARSEEVRRAVVRAVTSSWNDYQATERVISASREQVRAADLALDGVIQEQQVGLRTTLDVLDAQQEAAEAQLALVRAERDAYVAAHLVLQAVGELRPQDLGINAPLYDPDQSRRAVRRTLFGTQPVGPLSRPDR